MAKVVAPGHLRFKDDEKLDLHPTKKAVLIAKSKKIFKTYQRKGIACRSQKALHDLTSKTPPTPQTESSSTINYLPKDIDDEEFPLDEFDHCACCQLQEWAPEENDPFMKYDLASLQNDPDDWKLKEVPHSPKPLPKLDDKLPYPPFSFPDDPFHDFPAFQVLPGMDVDHSIPHEGEDSDDDDSLDEEIDD